jgi:hypothetical protein
VVDSKSHAGILEEAEWAGVAQGSNWDEVQQKMEGLAYDQS